MKEKGLKKIMKDSLYSNSIYLMLSSAVMAAFGFVSWLIIARLFSVHDVGLATTLISAMGLLVSISMLGFNVGLIRFLPGSKNKNDKINTAFTIVFLATIVVSSIFLVGLKFFSPDLIFIKNSLLLSLIFIVFILISASNSLFESIFIAFRSAKFNLLKNSIFSVLRVILPFAFISFGAFGAFSAYMSAMLVAVGIALLILVSKFKYKPKLVFYDNIIKDMGRYSLGNYFAGFVGGLVIMVLPLMITAKISPTITAYFFMALQIANLLYVIPNATTNSLFAEGSYDEHGLGKQVKKAIKIISIILIPSIIVIGLFGNYVLLAFGSEYSNQGFMFLRIMALSAIFVGINSIYGGILKVKKKIGRILIVNVIGAIVIIGGSFLMIEQGKGLMGVGIAYILGQAVMGLSYWITSFNK